MKELMLKQIDVFTTMPFCGNPALVVTRADGLTFEQMQEVAAEMNILESTFVTSAGSPGADFRVRFFTPSSEYDFSGHAMIATCFALVEEEIVALDEGVTSIKMETNAGVIRVDCHFHRGDASSFAGESRDCIPMFNGGTAGLLRKIMIHRTIDEFRPAGVGVDEVASILGIDPGEISGTGLPVEIVFNGVHQLVIPVRRSSTLARMCPDLIKLKLLNRRAGVQTTDVFTLDPLHDDCVTYSRHFSPAMGMWEDLGSGAGGASIAAYLYKHGIITEKSMIMEQGLEIERLSRVHVEVAEGKEGIDIRAGGLAVTSMSRSVTIAEGGITVT